MLQIVTGVIFQHLVQRGNDCAVSQHHLQAQDQVAGHAEPDHLVAACIGCDISADIAGTPGAQVKREQEPCIFRRFLNGLQGSTGEYGHGHGFPVQFFNPVQALKGQCNLFFPWSGAAAQARKAALYDYFLVGG